MNKKEVLEIKRRFKKQQATFSRLAGCYVDGNRQKVCTFNEPFLNQEDDVFYKYLEIANKTLSGTIGNHLLNLEFPLSEEMPGGHQQILMGIRECGLMNDALLDTWYDLVIEQYQITGNYLILLFADAYDVPMKTSDDLKSGESEEIYSYILCAVCPVLLSQPGLSFHESEQKIGARIRDWVVGTPDTGFLFPAFNGRSTDIHNLLFFSKDPKKPHTEFMENVLGCGSIMTQAEQKIAFHTIVNQVLGPDEEETKDKLLGIQKTLSDMNEEYEAAYDNAPELPLLLTKKSIEDACADNHVPEDKTEKIVDFVDRTFGDSMPDMTSVIDAHALKTGGLKLENAELLHELAEKTLEAEHLKKELSEISASAAVTSADAVTEASDTEAASEKRVRLYLRPFRESDAEKVVSWVANEQIFFWWSAGRFGQWPLDPQTLIDHYKNTADTDDLFPMTAIDATGKVCGHLIFRIPGEDRTRVRLGFIIVDSSRRGQGLGKTMVTLALRYAHQFLGASEVSLGVFEDNSAAKNCYLAAGFTEDTSVPAEVYEYQGTEYLCLVLKKYFEKA